MNRVQVRLVDPAHGKVVTKTFDGREAVEQAIAYLQRFQEPQKKLH